ncbi:uncharacterized protein [Leuresthes tenuis]|uniref:uncharacterized protein isoform X2 n=1 Tax=Leuresthes tenuis TaxID=355514 RepID=UPI003B51461B
MELAVRTLFLCLVFALSRAAPRPGISATGNPKPPKCDDVALNAIASDNSGRLYIFTGIPLGNKTHCHYHRDKIQAAKIGMIGAYIPQCDENGEYQKHQCHGSTGHCWCVDHLGKEIPGTRTPAGTPSVDCSKQDGRHCHHQRESLKITGVSGPLIGAYIPQCDEDGQYAPRQCHGSTGHCWCVDRSGQEKPGTRTPPGTPSLDCDKIVDQCKRHKDSVVTTTPEGLPLAGAYVPQCDENGKYQPQQSHGSTGYSWCVDHKGQEIPGTKTPPGTPSVDCSKAGPIYLRLDASTGPRPLPRTRPHIELGDEVDAAYFYSDKVHLIRGDQVYAFQPDAPYALIEGYPKTVKEELGFEGQVDAAFICPNQSTLYAVRGPRMFAVDLTAATRAVTEPLPFPVGDIDACLCDRDGIKIFKGSHYYQYESVMILTMGKIAPVPQKITSAILGCED